MLRSRVFVSVGRSQERGTSLQPTGIHFGLPQQGIQTSFPEIIFRFLPKWKTNLESKNVTYATHHSVQA